MGKCLCVFGEFSKPPGVAVFYVLILIDFNLKELVQSGGVILAIRKMPDKKVLNNSTHLSAHDVCFGKWFG